MTEAIIATASSKQGNVKYTTLEAFNVPTSLNSCASSPTSAQMCIDLITQVYPNANSCAPCKPCRTVTQSGKRIDLQLKYVVMQAGKVIGGRNEKGVIFVLEKAIPVNNMPVGMLMNETERKITLDLIHQKQAGQLTPVPVYVLAETENENIIKQWSEVVNVANACEPMYYFDPISQRCLKLSKKRQEELNKKTNKLLIIKSSEQYYAFGLKGEDVIVYLFPYLLPIPNALTLASSLVSSASSEDIYKWYDAWSNASKRDFGKYEALSIEKMSDALAQLQYETGNMISVPGVCAQDYTYVSGVCTKDVKNVAPGAVAYEMGLNEQNIPVVLAFWNESGVLVVPKTPIVMTDQFSSLPRVIRLPESESELQTTVESARARPSGSVVETPYGQLVVTTTREKALAELMQ